MIMKTIIAGIAAIVLIGCAEAEIDETVTVPPPPPPIEEEDPPPPPPPPPPTCPEPDPTPRSAYAVMSSLTGEFTENHGFYGWYRWYGIYYLVLDEAFAATRTLYRVEVVNSAGNEVITAFASSSLVRGHPAIVVTFQSQTTGEIDYSNFDFVVFAVEKMP
jgi:hypothetical protein